MGRALDFRCPLTGPETEGYRYSARDTLPAHRTTWDALADIEPNPGEDLALRGKWGDLLASIPEGNNYLWHTDRGGGKPLFGWRRRYWSFLLKLAKSRPSWTIQAQPGPAIGPFHWANRRLSMRELCRLQTFPDDVFIVGTVDRFSARSETRSHHSLRKLWGERSAHSCWDPARRAAASSSCRPTDRRRLRPSGSGQSRSDTGAWSATTPRTREPERATQPANAAPKGPSQTLGRHLRATLFARSSTAASARERAVRSTPMSDGLALTPACLESCQSSSSRADKARPWRTGSEASCRPWSGRESLTQSTRTSTLCADMTNARQCHGVPRRNSRSSAAL